MGLFKMTMTCLGLSLLGLGCGASSGVQECEPPGACSCEPGTERATACTCAGGSECEIGGSDVEFTCDGNASCGMTCGNDCLVVCPGTTSCEVTVGDDAIIECPGTSDCSVTCRGSCTLEMEGASSALLTCEGGASQCMVEGCSATDCGGGVFACRADCPD